MRPHVDAPTPRTSFVSDDDPTVRLPIGGARWLDALLRLPDDTTGLVLFAHGSGSGRHSPRNRQLADALHGAGLGTLLLDLLTPEEERTDRRTGALRFDIALLARRLGAVTDLLAARPELRPLRFGYFGASTGAAAALLAASTRAERVAAIVARGGRPDLAGPALQRVRAPTRLIVGGRDQEVMALNRAAMRDLPDVARLAIVPGATHLFEEPGALDAVAELARDWFRRRLAA
jgi:dienelactone hydrolase